MNALLVFEAAARLGSLTRAAEELHIAQSAVSRHVSNLERQIGLVLFIRAGNRVTLTNAGRQVSDAATAGLGGIRDVLQALKFPSQRVLTIACTHDIATFLILPRMTRLRNAIPAHQLRVVAVDNYAKFDNADIDLSIRYGAENEWPKMVQRKLFDEEIFPICAPSVISRYPSIIDDITVGGSEVPLLQLDPEMQGRFNWLDLLQDCSEDSIPFGPTLSGYAFMVEEAAAGRGVALGYKYITDNVLQTGTLVRLGDNSLRSDKAMYLVYRSKVHDLVDSVAAALLA